MDIIKSIEHGLDQLDSDRGAWDELKLHISDLGIWSGLEEGDRKCPRSLWYRLNGLPKEPFTAGEKLMFLQGHRLEELVVEILDKSMLLDTQVPVRIDDLAWEGGVVIGAADIVMTKRSGGAVVIDVKTRRGNSFKYSKSVKPAEKMQVLGYAYALRGCVEGKISGMILEVDREGQNFCRVWEFGIRTGEYLSVIDAVKELLEIKTMKKPPDGFEPTLIRGKNKGPDSLKLNIPWQCRWCKYAKTTCDYCPTQEIFEQHGKVVGHISDSGEINGENYMINLAIQ